MIVLSNSTELLRATLGGANKHDVVVNYEQITEGGVVEHQSTQSAPATAAGHTILAAPTRGKRRIVSLYIKNTTANSTTVQLAKVVDGTAYNIGPLFTLTDGLSVVLDAEGRFQMYTKTGAASAAA